MRGGKYIEWHGIGDQEMENLHGEKNDGQTPAHSEKGIPCCVVYKSFGWPRGYRGGTSIKRCEECRRK